MRVVVFVLGKLRLLLGRFAATDAGRMDVDHVLDAQASIEKLFDRLVPVAFGISADARAVVGHFVDGLA
jgi:hypothetical protein